MVLDILVGPKLVPAGMNKGGHNFPESASPDITPCAVCITCNEGRLLPPYTFWHPFIKSQPFSSQPVLTCGVISPQAQNLTLLPAEFQEVLGTVFIFLKVLLGWSFVTWGQSFSLSIVWNLLQGAHPLSHHPNHWWRHWEIPDVLDTPFVTGLQLDVKALIMTHFRPGITTIFSSPLLRPPVLSQLENKNAVGDSVKNVTWDGIYSLLSFYSHSQPLHQLSFF